jgi:hypothetical protein
MISTLNRKQIGNTRVLTPCWCRDLLKIHIRGDFRCEYYTDISVRKGKMGGVKV